METLDLLGTLKHYWGYDQFRPMQERIIRSILGGTDVAVIMPTGGGKSLCYQVPAIALEKTTVVISPLISLMQDQCEQLSQMGISAAVLNSSLSWREQQTVLQEAQSGAFRLLYLSPERIAREDTFEWLKKIPLALFAIDEAHCISEWGHEFRPEYRHLRMLREHFPEVPIAAFTASATKPVRGDILEQLRLREPHKYIVSFHRPNLRYLVKQCNSVEQYQILLRVIEQHADGNVIVYAPTIALVEETVDFLVDHNVAALPYHGKMENQDRRRNQEQWMNDDVRVMVGTLAFGLGINKPAVRAVIHLGLPKSIEQYYQEAGRSGRDLLPSDCILLWQKKDAGLLAYFIEKVADLNERERAWQRYRSIRDYVELPRCRAYQICKHFGETPKWEACGICDVCAAGLPEWLSPKCTTAGSITVRRPILSDSLSTPPCDPELFQYMRQWRTRTARQENVPSYIVMSDASMQDLCRRRPQSISQLTQVSGIGESKAKRYGAGIIGSLAEFERGARSEPMKEVSQIAPAEETIQLLAAGKTMAEIATLHDRRLGTIVNRVATLIESGRLQFEEDWITAGHRELIDEQIALHGTNSLKVLKTSLPDAITYDEIRLVVAVARRSNACTAAK